MSLFNVMDISSTGMSAENVRLNTTASNIANANSISSSIDTTYKARHPVFAAALEKATGDQSKGVGVQVLGVVESAKPVRQDYAPHNPLANEEGYIFRPNVNVIEEMADMLSASKAYETNVQVADTTKRIYRRVLQLGQSQ